MSDIKTMEEALLKVTSHNYALLDALADAKEKAKIQENYYNNILRVMLIKMGGSITISEEFLEDFENDDLVVEYSFDKEKKELKLWLVEADEDEHE